MVSDSRGTDLSLSSLLRVTSSDFISVYSLRNVSSFVHNKEGATVHFQPVDYCH